MNLEKPLWNLFLLDLRLCKDHWLLVWSCWHCTYLLWFLTLQTCALLSWINVYTDQCTFLSANLAIVDMVYCTSSCPTMIGILLVGSKAISYKPCIVQMFVFYLGAAMEMFAIAVMAFDRVFAISNPLWYPSFLTNLWCILITISLWLVGTSVLFILPASLVSLPVCYSTLKYMFCDYAAILRATYVDPEPYFNSISVITTCIMFGTFGFICLSYIKIVIVVLKMSIKHDKKKAIHTCLSHVIVIVCFYAPTFTRVALTRIGVVLTLEEQNGLMMGSIIAPSLVNPFVSCFRTEEIRKKLFKIFSKIVPDDRRKQ